MKFLHRPASTSLMALATLAIAATAPATARTVLVKSPNGRIEATVSDDDGHLVYMISMDGKPVLASSALSIRTDGVELGDGAVLGKATWRRTDRSDAFAGGKARAVDHAWIASIAAATEGQTFTVDVHAADDGVGVRLRLPARAGRKIEADNSSWRFAATDPVVWATKLTPEYESLYTTTKLSALGRERYGLPMTAKIGDRWVVISEAALVDYGDLAVMPGRTGELSGLLYADAKGWMTDGEVVQPWRVTIVARNLTSLVNSTLIRSLNPPPSSSLAQARWIRPGRSSWQWLASGAPIESEQHQWVDWTRQLGFEYYLVDEGWAQWAKPWETLADTVAYAKTKGVAIWLWVHSKQVRTPEQRKAYLHRAASLGIAGVKVDFPRPTDREWSNWYADFARDAAAEKLMVDFHGATKPTGTERTWPNVLTREGVRGHEWHITRYKRVLPPSHDTILPFGRYVVGPGDYTPVVFDPKELQGLTWSHELAQGVILTSPFLTFGGHPASIIANPARSFVEAIPAVWDETIVLQGSEPGVVAAFARRKGQDWFIAVLNGAEARSMDVPLDFLKSRTCQATMYRDGTKADSYDQEVALVSPRQPLHVSLVAGGGFAARLTSCRRR